MKHFLSAFLLVAFVLPAFSQQSLEPLITKIRSQPLTLPAETALVSFTPADKAYPRQTFSIKRTFAPDGVITTEWKSATGQLLQNYRPDGTLLYSKVTDLNKSITVEVKTDTGRTSVQTVTTEKGKIKSDKKTALKPAIALRDELQMLNLQAWNAGVRDGLKFQSLSPDGGMVGDFQILYKTVSDPTSLSDKYTYPAEFKTALATRSSYVVADMSLQGVGAFFYPHHFYLIYTVGTTGLEFAGYFGEDPKNPIFQYAPVSK